MCIFMGIMSSWVKYPLCKWYYIKCLNLQSHQNAECELSWAHVSGRYIRTQSVAWRRCKLDARVFSEYNLICLQVVCSRVARSVTKIEHKSGGWNGVSRLYQPGL
jgi:hypothetical protein